MGKCTELYTLVTLSGFRRGVSFGPRMDFWGWSDRLLYIKEMCESKQSQSFLKKKGEWDPLYNGSPLRCLKHSYQDPPFLLFQTFISFFWRDNTLRHYCLSVN